MEEKKLSQGHNSIRTFFGISHVYKHFFRKFFTRKGSSFLGNLGFTFIELVVVILVLSILLLISLLVLNPVAQIQKAKDVTRQNDLNQLHTALDTYYNDKGCYPKLLFELTAPIIYIKEIPKDPDIASGVNYNYLVDNDADCPQWFTIITKGYKTPSSSICPLKTLDSPNDCTPINYETGYDTCKISGNIDSSACSVIVTKELPALDTVPLVPGGCYCADAKFDLVNGRDCNDAGVGGPNHYCAGDCKTICQQ